MLLFQNFFLAIVGIALLIWGAEKFVFYSSNLAKRFGVSDLLIGLTLIAFGTSAPEIFIGISSIFNDAGEIPIGTIIGSNISNIALIFGISCFFIHKKYEVATSNIIILILVTVFTGITLFDGEISYLESFGLVILFIVFILVLFSSENSYESDDKSSKGSLMKIILLLFVGLLALSIGAQLAVTYSEKTAIILGVPDLIIGLTLLALGTSLPELATSISALKNKQNGIVIGNIIGSNILNLVLITPMIGFFSYVKLGREVIYRDFLTMLTLTIFFVIVLVFLRKYDLNLKFSYFLGVGFVFSYLAYISLLVGFM